MIKTLLFHYELLAALDVDASGQIFQILHLHALEVVDGGGCIFYIKNGVINTTDHILNN